MKNIIEFVLWFLGLVLLQVLLFNNIEIAGMINPFLYIYFIIALPIHINRISLTIIGFVLGLVIDIFSNTWGIHAMATTMIAFLRPYVFRLVSTQEELDRVMPRFRTMGANYIKYIVLMTFVHHFMLFTLEAFSFSYIWILLLKVLVSSVITILVIFVLEKVRK
jgi:rod shape-determining protein MreD